LYRIRGLSVGDSLPLLRM